MSYPFDKSLPRMVGFCGPAGVGKDTLADRLVIECGYTKIAFADPVRQACAAALGLPKQWFIDRELKDSPTPCHSGMTPRDLMKSFGHAARELDPEFWVTRLHHRCLGQAPHRVVIPDIRYNNEAEYIVSQGGIILELAQPGLDYKKDHESEMGIKGVYISGVYEADTPEAMYEQVLARLERIGDTLRD